MYGVQSLLNHCVALTDIVRGTSVAYRGVSYLSLKCPFPCGLVPLCNMWFLGPISLHLKQCRSWFSRFFHFSGLMVVPNRQTTARRPSVEIARI